MEWKFPCQFFDEFLPEQDSFHRSEEVTIIRISPELVPVFIHPFLSFLSHSFLVDF